MSTNSADSLTIPERVVEFLSLKKPAAYCDDCVATALAVRRAQISTVTSTLGLCREYSRDASPCAGCGRSGKFVTRVQPERRA
jgi:hypothetical protein